MIAAYRQSRRLCRLEREVSLSVVALLGLSSVLLVSPPFAQAQVPAWTRWETTLTSGNAYSNPYKNLLLQVSWTCLTNCFTPQISWESRLPIYGFWDGGPAGKTFKIRAAFPQPLGGAATATWRWATTCTNIAGSEVNCALDSGLNSNSPSNIVTVTPSDAAHGITNPLYTGGLLRLGEGSVVEDGQLVRGNAYLITDNGPLYWQGDTAWAASMRATFNAGTSVSNPCTNNNWTTNAWKCYVQDRASKSFSAVHLAIPQYWMNNPFQDASGQPPFVTGTLWSQWNPAYWQGFEQKIEHANQRGLVVFIVGLMEPSYQHLVDPITDAQRYPPLADARTFARNVAARLAGNFVIFSPGFDTRPNTTGRSDLIRGVGAEIDAVSLRQLITNHFGGQTLTSEPGAFNDYRDFESESWLDLFLFQSGQARTLRSDTNATPQLLAFTQRTRTMPLDLRAFPLRKASANAETIYDFQGVALEDPNKNPAWLTNYTQYRVRHTGYLTTLSGAFGYSIGVYGLFEWGLGDGPVSTVGGLTEGPLVTRTPQNSVSTISADQQRHLGNLFRAHRWDWFAPALLVRNNPTPEGSNQHLQMVVSRDLTRRSTLAYMPDNQSIRLQLSATLYPSFLSGRWTKKFFNPRTGQYDPAPVVPTLVGGTTDIYQTNRPNCAGGGQSGNCDWILELIDTMQGPAFAQSLDGQSLEVWAAWEEATDSWNVVGQLMDARGSAASSEIQIGEPTPSIQRLPLVARGADGGFLVVWEAENQDGDRTGVFARQVNSRGEPQGRPFQVSEASAGRQFEPVVTADAAGQYVIAWTNYSLADQTVEIKVRRFTVNGKPLGREFTANSKKPAVNRRSPLISSDPLGNIVVGWQEYTPANREWSIVTREFDTKGATGAEREIEKSTTEYLALERLEMDALGNFEVVWQRVLEAQSRGHYSRKSDRTMHSLGDAVLIAGGLE